MSVTISNLTATWSNTSVVYTAIKMNVANNGSAAGSKLMDLQANGVSRFVVFANGSTTINGTDVLTTIDNRVVPVFNQANTSFNQANTAFNRANNAISYKGFVLANTQTFLESGTWRKPTLANAALAGANTFAIIQVWGAGASGGTTKQSARSGGGGGGGAFHERIIKLNELADTVTVTIGLGGAARTADQAGAAGGTSSFGTHISAFGGGGGGRGDSGEGGGGGGSGSVGSVGGNGASQQGDGGSASSGIIASVTPYRMFLPGIDISSTNILQSIECDFYTISSGTLRQNLKNGAGGAGGLGTAGESSTYGGGGGGAGRRTGGEGYDGGSSVWGGAGGGGGSGDTISINGGVSTYGGNGANGSTGSTNAQDGFVPGGGGGGAEQGNSGAGANGEVIVYTFDLVL